jgi:hypothetical protein
VAANYRHDGEEAEDVLRELIDILSRVGPLGWREVPETGIGATAAGPLDDELDDSQPALVARLLETAAEKEPTWTAEDLRGMLRHQLAMRLADIDLKADTAALVTPPQSAVAPLVTLADLFRHGAPPLALFEAVKRYGRKHVHRPTSSLPDDIASALYFGAIAAALVRHNRLITTSDHELLRYGFDSSLARAWIEPPLRELFVAALSCLAAHEEAGSCA